MNTIHDLHTFLLTPRDGIPFLELFLMSSEGDCWVVCVRCTPANLSSLVWCCSPFTSSTARGWILYGLPELVTLWNSIQMYVHVVQTAGTQMWPVSAYVPGPASCQPGGGRRPPALAFRPGSSLCTQVPAAPLALSGLWEPRDIGCTCLSLCWAVDFCTSCFLGAAVDWRDSSPVWNQALFPSNFVPRANFMA